MFVMWWLTLSGFSQKVNTRRKYFLTGDSNVFKVPMK